MSRRRAFDIEAPKVEPPAPTVPARRGPMAAAVRETAAALSKRAAQETAIRAENDALAEAHVAAKRAGLLLEAVDPDAIDDGWLIRDRMLVRDAEIDALKTSIREIGLSNPIRLARVGAGRFALVQGWRRLAAWRELRAEGEGFARIPAAIGPADDNDAAALAGAYRRMVDENLMRREVSFAEMARLARAYADAHLAGDVDAAVTTLYRSASPQKRSYIRNFVEVMDVVGDALSYPAAIPRSLGVALRGRMRSEPETAAAIRVMLSAFPARSEDEELALLRGVADLNLPLPTADHPDPFSAALQSVEDAAERRIVPPTTESTARVRAAASGAEAVALANRVTISFAASHSWSEAKLYAALDAFLRTLDGYAVSAAHPPPRRSRRSRRDAPPAP